MAVVYIHGDSPINESFAKEVAEDLTLAYPNHSWWVEVKGGCIIVKHFMLSGMRGTIGMVRHLAALDGDAKKRKQSILTAGGELLERANLIRGAYTGEQIESMELEAGLAKYWHQAAETKVIH